MLSHAEPAPGDGKSAPTYRCKFAVDVFDQEGAELREYLQGVGYASRARQCAAAAAYRSLALVVRHAAA
jgi:hypothetical protein